MSKDNALWIMLPVLIVMMGVLLLKTAQQPLLPSSPSTQWSMPSITEPRPRPRISAIPRDDPAVLAFSKFAKDHKMGWHIEPDDIDGTDYCAELLEGRGYGYLQLVSVGCKGTLEEATRNAIEDYESQKLGIGSK